MEFKKRVLSIKFNGGIHDVSYPTIKQLKDLNVKKENETELDMTYRFLSSLGLPVEVIDEMEPDHIKEIIEVLTGQKKS